MSDRVIRDELLESERWLSLPTDSHRLVFVTLVLRCDDYGNLEGGPRRLYRWMQGFTQIKTEADSIRVMSDLQDVGLALRYEVSGKEYWHIPRFRNARRYWSRKCPTSPYEEQTKQETIKNPRAGLTQTCVNPSGGVGVGVGVKQEKPSTDADKVLRLETWEAFRSAYASRYQTEPVRNAAVNSQIAGIVRKLGDSAPAVATFYLTHNEPFYIKKQHPASMLSKDAEGLHTQWKRGRKVTTLEARSAEQKDAVSEQIQRLRESAREDPWTSTQPLALPTPLLGRK